MRYAVLFLFFLSPLGFAQFENYSTPRMHALGESSIAMTNEKGRGLIMHSTSTPKAGAKASAWYFRDTIHINSDGYEVDFIRSGPSVGVLAPVSP
jgi:hypothetical protein